MSIDNFHQRFIWRVTGFPIDLLEQFALPGHAGEVDSNLGGAQSARNWQAVWQQSARQLAACGLEQRFEGAFFELRSKLAEVSRGERFQIAVGCSSPQAARLLANLGQADPGRRRSKDKRRELLAMRYLQRFTTKCETSAFFGPVSTGQFSDLPEAVRYHYDPAGYRGKGLPGEQFLHAIIRRMRRRIGLLLQLRVRRSAGLLLRGKNRLIHPRRGLVQLSPLEYRLLAGASGQPVSTILNALPIEEHQPALIAIVNLLGKNFLFDDLAGAWNSESPADFLQEILRKTAQSTPELQQMLEQLSRAGEQWPLAAADHRHQMLNGIKSAAAAAGMASLTGKGRFFSDHQPLIEEGFCHGAHLTLDRQWAAGRLKDLEAVLRKGVLKARREKLARHQSIRALFNGQLSRRLPLADFIEVMAEAGQRPAKTGAGAVSESAAIQTPLIISPDIMVAAKDMAELAGGGGDWILSDCHTAIGGAGFFTRAMPDSENWLADYSSFLNGKVGSAQPLIVTNHIWNKTFRIGHLPDAGYLENGTAAGPGQDCLGLDDLAVGVVDGQLQCFRQSDGQALALLPACTFDPEEPLNLFAAPRFRSPWSAGPERRYEESILVSRAGWRITGDSLPSAQAGPLEVFSWAQALRRRKGLPRWIFIHSERERKPQCVDFFNPFLCEELLRLSRQGDLQATEMHPAPDNAWVEGPDGRYLNEMRLQFAAAK